MGPCFWIQAAVVVVAVAAWQPPKSRLRRVGHLTPVAPRTAISLLQSPVPLVAPAVPKLGVLMLNLGGPEKQDDVEGFLYNLFVDPDIIRLPKWVSGLQKPLATLISKRRAPKSREAYESIGGGSPILRYTTAQARALESALERRGVAARCYIGMRYWYPFTEQALEEIKADGVNSLVILPLYPQFSISTSGSSLRVLQETFAKDRKHWGEGDGAVSHTVVPAWYHRPGYVIAVSRLIAAELATFSAEDAAEGGLHVLFSAHGVPQSYVAAGDPYQAQMVECVDLITSQLPSGVTCHLSYQSRVGPIQWLRPYTDDKIPELGALGVKNLVVVPISFVSEHIETLEEIDMEYKELALESGIKRWRRCPALNLDPAFIEEMASMVTDALAEPSLSVSAACLMNNCGAVDLELLDRRLTGSEAGKPFAAALAFAAGQLDAVKKLFGR